MIKYNKEIQVGYAGLLGEVVSVAIEDYAKYKNKVRDGEGDFIYYTAQHFLFADNHKESFGDKGGSVILSLERLMNQMGWGNKLNMGQVRLLAEKKVRDKRQEWSHHLTKGDDNEEDRNGSLFCPINEPCELGD